MPNDDPDCRRVDRARIKRRVDADADGVGDGVANDQAGHLRNLSVTTRTHVRVR